MNQSQGGLEMSWSAQPMRKVVDLDLALCQRLNRVCECVPARQLFGLVSWLGDGKFWYALMVFLPLIFGQPGLEVTLRMALASLFGVLIYKTIKQLTHRPRPYMAHEGIVLGATPMDQFSFPSGHTLHAVMFTIIIVSALPVMAVLLLPFTALVATSRVVLGFHYPTDVLLGALIGAGLGVVALAAPFP
jgi:undecaprenyl-diphosphatase